MSIAEQEKLLSAEWAKQREKFFCDGVICEQAYLQSDPKIVIVLKEPNAHDDDSGDIRDWVRAVDALDPTWDNIARWVDGIRKRRSTMDWREFETVTPESKTATLKNVCAMNLKKSAGGSSADWEELNEAATTDAKFIKRQYELYKPDLTICCGASVDNLFKTAVQHNHTDWQRTTRGFWWYETGGKYVFSHCHPAKRIETNLKFYSLIDAVNEVLGKHNLVD